MTAGEIAELRKIEAAATRGPWEWAEAKWNAKIGQRRRGNWIYCLQGPSRYGSCNQPWADEYDYSHIFGLRWYQVKGSEISVMRDEDKALIAAARNALIPLLDEVERLQAENAALRAKGGEHDI